MTVYFYYSVPAGRLNVHLLPRGFFKKKGVVFLKLFSLQVIDDPPHQPARHRWGLSCLHEYRAVKFAKGARIMATVAQVEEAFAIAEIASLFVVNSSHKKAPVKILVSTEAIGTTRGEL